MKMTMFIILLSLFMQPIKEEEFIIGNWNLSENNTEIQIVKEGSIFQGTIVKSDAKKAIGKIVLRDLKKDGEVWKGKFYALQKDRLVDATLKAIGDNTLEMEVSAGMKSKIVKMTRAE